MNSVIGDIPKHQYVFVDTLFTHQEPQGFVPAVWFGIVSYPGRAWGLNVMLESGAIYRSLPPHAIAYDASPPPWTIQDAQTWDCYGEQFACHEYKFLAGLDCNVRANKQEHTGNYLFTVAPIGDGFSAYPEQAKEFSFISLHNDRLTIQPTNHLVFRERSFTTGDMSFPKGLQRQTDIWSCE